MDTPTCSLSWDLPKELEKLRIQGSFCDVVLVGKDDHCISAHKCVLASVSPTLYKMCTSETRQPATIFVQEYTIEVVSKLLQLIYSSGGSGREFTTDAKENAALSKLALELDCKFLLGSEEHEICSIIKADKCKISNKDQESNDKNKSKEVSERSVPLPDRNKKRKRNKSIHGSKQISTPLVKWEENDPQKSENYENEISDKKSDELISYNSDRNQMVEKSQSPCSKTSHVGDKSEDELFKDWKKCEYCSQFKGKKKGSLEFHSMNCCHKHSACDKCHKPLMNAKEVSSHSCPKIPVQHVCDLCGKVLVSKDGLRLHKEVHDGIKSKTCPVCGKGFQRAIQLKSHIKRVHSEERPFVCGHCNVTFALQYDLTRHMKVMHSKGDQTEKEDKNSLVTVGMVSDLFACLICGIVFTDEYSLQIHENKHGDSGSKVLPKILPKQPQPEQDMTLLSENFTEISAKDEASSTTTQFRISQGEIVQVSSGGNSLLKQSKAKIPRITAMSKGNKRRQKKSVAACNSRLTTKKGSRKPEVCTAEVIPMLNATSPSQSIISEVSTSDTCSMKVFYSSNAADSLTLPLDLTMTTALPGQHDDLGTSQHSSMMDENHTASSILVSKFLDQQAMVNNFAEVMGQEEDVDISDSVPLNLSYGHGHLPLSHTFGCFDSSVTMTADSIETEHDVDSNSIYHSILGHEQTTVEDVADYTHTNTYDEQSNIHENNAKSINL